MKHNWTKRILRFETVLFIIVNIIAYNQAYRFTHFDEQIAILKNSAHEMYLNHDTEKWTKSIDAFLKRQFVVDKH